MNLDKRLVELKKRGLYRRISDRITPQGRIILIKDRKYINFSSNDYLGLASHPHLREASIKAIEQFGTGAGASRLLAGGTELHRELERLSAEFKGTEDALLFVSGYMANVGAIPVLSEDAIIYSDELNHASIIDGCRLSRADVVVYPHRDVETLRRLLKKRSTKDALIVTDTVFSMDGDIAPVKELYEVARENEATLYLDDAHGTGVLGDGRGVLHHFGIGPEGVVVMMTFSKALGSLGGAVCADRQTIDWQRNTSRSFIFTTALPPGVVGASIEALNIVKKNPSIVEKLWKNRETLLKGLSGIEVEIGKTESPIVPLLLEDNEKALKLMDFLLSKGLYAPAIRYPTVRIPRIRITVTASHTSEDIEILIETLREARGCGLF